MRVFDSLERIVAALVDEVREPGGYADPWDGTQVSSGFRTPRMKTGGCTATTRVVPMK